MSLASHRPLSCPPPPPLLPPWQPCTALLTQAATADAAAGKAARKRFAPPFSFPFLLSLSPSPFRGGRRNFSNGLLPTCPAIVSSLFFPLSVQCLAMPSIVYADPLAFLAGGCTDVYIYNLFVGWYFSFFFLFRFFFGMVSFGIWEGWFHRDARRLIELLPLSRTFSMDVARCVRWPTIGSRDLVQNFSLSFLLFFLFETKTVSRYRSDEDKLNWFFEKELLVVQLSA